MSKNANTKPATKTQTGPGRPKAQVKLPRKAQWTFDDLCTENGVDIVTGKGAMAKLTLRNWLKNDRFTKSGNPKRTSTVIVVKDASKPPKGEKGLDRKRLVYSLRNPAIKSAPKATVKAATPAPEPVSVDMAPATPAPATIS